MKTTELICRSCGKSYTEESEGYEYSDFPYSYSAAKGYRLYCWLVYPNEYTPGWTEDQDEDPKQIAGAKHDERDDAARDPAPLEG